MDLRTLLVLVCSLCFGMFLLTQAHAQTITGQAYVIDGDTLEIAARQYRYPGREQSAAGCIVSARRPVPRCLPRQAPRAPLARGFFVAAAKPDPALALLNYDPQIAEETLTG